MKVEEITRIVGGQLRGEPATEILRAAALETAKANEIAFVEKADAKPNSNAACLIVLEEFDFETAAVSTIAVKNPKLAFAKIAAILHAPRKRVGIDERAFVAASATIGKNVFVSASASIGENSSIGTETQIFDGVRVGANVSVGANCFIYPNAVIYDDVSIGDGVIVHAGAVIGADGFGFVRDGENGYVKFPQIGTVTIGDNVEIGVNSCIDRGALGETRIGAGTKIDNLVQIAHNVIIGERVIIAAQTGISGSTVIEDDCVIGGQVGVGDHAKILSGAVIGSQAGILPGKIVRAGVWWGTPVQPLDEYKRQNARLKGISRLKEQVDELKKQIARILNNRAD